MDIQTAKQIRIADFLYSLGHSPVKQQGINLWYKSPLREETEPSFKVNIERNQWYDLQLVKVEISLHWHRNFTVPTMYLIFYRKSRNRHHTYIPCLSLWQAVIFRTEFSGVGHCTVDFSCPACLSTGKRDKHGTGEKRM